MSAAKKVSPRKGIPNKAARKRISVADRLENLNVDLLKEIWIEVTQLTGKERVDCLLKLLEYCAPKMRAVEITEEKEPGATDDDLDKIPRNKIVELLKGGT